MAVRLLPFVAFSLSIAVSPAVAQKTDSGVARLLAQVRSYSAQWQAQLLAIVAEEHYQQTRSVLARREWGGRAWERVETRRIQSDLLLLRAPAGGTWMAFRDVITVDDTPVGDRQQRFDELFRTSTAQLATDARRIADESARFNVGVTRNMNVPIAALVFLEDTYAASTRWAIDTHTGAEVVLTFEQRVSPFAIADQRGKGVPARGRLWIDQASGRITRTELRAGGRRTASRLLTEYGAVPRVDVFVPLRMDEQTFAGSRERVDGAASYTNHRVFQAHGRVIGDPTSH